jgi:hypothetical protein
VASRMPARSSRARTDVTTSGHKAEKSRVVQESTLEICASRVVNQAAMGTWTSPWLCDCQMTWDMSARRVSS